MVDQDKKILNKQQREAVKHGVGPLLIIAGAGTGKTTVITERIKWLVATGKAKPSEILALTFTDKAAREMEERVDMAMPYGYTDMWISTFHSFCDRVLRQEAVQIGLDPGYKLMTQAETTQFLIKNLFQFKLKYFRPLGNPTKFIGGMMQHFSRLKDEDVSPTEYIQWVQNQKSRQKGGQAKVNPPAGGQNDKSKFKIDKEEVLKFDELAGAYRQYEELKVKEGKMDFGDLVSNVLKLFRMRKNVLGQYQKQFKYVLIDEFQDTNFAQFSLLKILLPPKKSPNIAVVGDDSQSIYKFRGAAVSNILQFMKEYKKAKQVILVKNYRSTQIILDCAYRLIKNNDPDTLEVKLGVSKDLKAVRKTEELPVELIQTDRVENEAEAVAKKIKELVSEPLALRPQPYAYSDFAILVRANNHADPFVRALQRAGIPYQFLGPGKLFRQEETKDLIAYLKVLYNFEDNVAWYRILSMDLFDLSARDLAAIVNYSRKQNLSIFESSEKVLKISVSEKTKDKVDRLVKMVHRHLKLVPKETAGQILYYFLQDSGLLKVIADYKTPVEEKMAQNISKFFDRLKSYEVNHEDATITAVVDWINLSMDLGESPLASDLDWTQENRVNLLTVHSSKGLEFPIIFLINLVSARFPTNRRREQIPIPQELIKEILPSGDFHEQEERRLFYVGMTRAEDRLFLTAANYYGEAKREKKISPFVYEALGKEEIEKLDIKRLRKKQTEQLAFLGWQKPEEPHFAKASRGGQLPITYLSFSQIDTYDKCPRQYRFRFIQRIPVPSAAAASFGSSVHNALRDFYRLVQELSKNSQGAKKKPTQKDLFNLLNQNWMIEGYASKAHEKRMKKKGEQILANYYEKAFDPNLVPQELEQSFVIKVSPTLKVGGRIDRVDPSTSLGVKGIEIIDYKTGRTVDQKDVDKSLQMTIYALAATDKGIHGRKPEEVTLSFYFLDAGEKKSTTRSAGQLKEVKDEIVQKAEEISKSDFKPKPGIWCDFCDFRLLCEAWS
ncbi:ATP-dependent helicase [Patescibacteria group bacterium]